MVGSGRTRKLIVGVDPGLNCGLAILSIDGAPILVESRREWPIAKIIERIREFGEPTIISSDVSPAPSLLEILSRKLNAILFEPTISMSTEEKQKISKIYAEYYGVNPQNVHEMDALAAAVKAYHYYKNKFEQVDAKLRELGCDLPPDDVKDLVARGYSIATAIRILSAENSKREYTFVESPSGESMKLKETIKRLTEKLMLEKERNRLLQAANRELQSRIKDLEAEIETLKATLERVYSGEAAQMRREKEYQRLLEEIRVLKSKIAEQEAQIESYKRMLSHLQHLDEISAKEGLTLLKPIESFTKEGLERAFKIYNIKVGDITFILDPSGGGSTTARSLVMRGIRAVIVRGKMSHHALEVFEEYNIPVIPADKVNIRWIEGLPYVDEEEIKRIIKTSENMRSIGALKMLKSIINDHLREIKEENRI
ncbi:MAG: DUF460 domain-containing protein [Candidatus Bathyarchaeia archaeon]